MTPPLIAVTMGDPAGIGPEILAKTFAETDFREENRAVVVGDAKMLERADPAARPAAARERRR